MCVFTMFNTVSLFTLMFLLSPGESLFCFKCSPSEAICYDPFTGPKQASITANNTLENCDDYKSQFNSYKSFCMKEKKYVNGRIQTRRLCTWKRSDDNSSLCPIGPGSDNGEIIFCETCNSDGCNHGTVVKITTALLAPILSLFLFK